MSRLALIVNTIMDAENIDVNNITRKELDKKVHDLHKLRLYCENLQDRLLSLYEITDLNEDIENSKKSFYGNFLTLFKEAIDEI